MRKLYILLFAFITLLPQAASSQFTFASGDRSLQLGGYLIGFYQYRPQFAGDPRAGNYDKNTFDLDDARFNMKGWTKGGFKFEIEVNFADIPAFISNTNDQTAMPITEANIQYINPYLNFKAGYFKLPFSPSSMIDKVPSPFLARANIANGSYFSRRDAGFMLFKDLWHQRINLYAGMVSGSGEEILFGQVDHNGKPEYFGRAEISSSYYRLEELDKKDLALPLGRLGFSWRYNQKTTFSGDATGSTTYTWNTQTPNLMIIDGTKISYDIDAAFMWHGFSAQFERDWSKNIAADGTPLAGILAEYNTKYFRDGGFLVQANYYSKFLRSGFAVRYDDFNPNDLQSGVDQNTVTFAYNFFCLPYGLTIKVHYAYRLKQQSIDQKWKEDELRGGLQYVF
jgi:hypothetical protein